MAKAKKKNEVFTENDALKKGALYSSVYPYLYAFLYTNDIEDKDIQEGLKTLSETAGYVTVSMSVMERDESSGKLIDREKSVLALHCGHEYKTVTREIMILIKGEADKDGCMHYKVRTMKTDTFKKKYIYEKDYKHDKQLNLFEE